MKNLKSFFYPLLILFACTNVFAQQQPLRDKPAAQAELDQITARGRALYEYDVAAWHSTDAVFALKPAEGSFTFYIGKKTDKGWTVAYGKLNDKKDRYLIAYEAVQGASVKEFKVTKYDQPKEDTGYYLNGAKALLTALTAFQNVSRAERPYNFAVLPAPNDEFYVYALPAQTETGIFPLGWDYRFRVSKDGAKVAETRRMHLSIVEFSVPPNAKPEAGYHTAVQDEIPEDSDVFHVLTRTPSVPEWLLTKTFVYHITPDGGIKYIMTVEAFKKAGERTKKPN
jgi:hypothetical protein